MRSFSVPIKTVTLAGAASDPINIQEFTVTGLFIRPAADLTGKTIALYAVVEDTTGTATVPITDDAGNPYVVTLVGASNSLMLIPSDISKAVLQLVLVPSATLSSSKVTLFGLND